MKTVQDYLDLGVEFAKGDVVIGYKNIEYSKNWHESLQDDDSDEGDIWLDCNIKSFVWRNNDGVKPEYKGLIDVVTASKHEYKGFSSESEIFEFEDDRFAGYVIKWRPVVMQSDNAKKEMQEKFLSALYADSQASKNVWNAIREQFRLHIGIDSPDLRDAFKLFNYYMESNPKFTIKEESPSRTMTVNIEGHDYLIPPRTPTVSPKEDKPMKPVYTAEMHAINELPPVDSKVKVCIEEAGFYVDEQDVKFEGKDVTVKAAFSNTESEKIVAVENEDGNCYCYIIECIKPIIKTIKVNGFYVPAPMSEAPMIGDKYFTPQTGYEVFYCKNSWRGDKFDSRFLSRGLIHSTESAAVAHAKAMLGIDPNA